MAASLGEEKTEEAMDLDLYDEFGKTFQAFIGTPCVDRAGKGNYIGPDLDDDDEEEGPSHLPPPEPLDVEEEHEPLEEHGNMAMMAVDGTLFACASCSTAKEVHKTMMAHPLFVPMN